MLTKEEKELKIKIKEFNKKYFLYRQDDEKLSEEVKKELARLGGECPIYYDSEQERSVKLTNLWYTYNPEIEAIFFSEIQQHFSVNSREEAQDCWKKVRAYRRAIEEKMAKIKAARERKKLERYEWN